MLHNRYADMLVKLRAESLAQGQEFLTWNEVQKCIDTVNLKVNEENESKGSQQAHLFFPFSFQKLQKIIYFKCVVNFLSF